MEEGTVTPKSLEDAVQNALKNYFPPLESSNARVEFYNKFKREADDYDNDFLKKYGGDLDITLIFAGLFSGVASAFIAAVRTQFGPDYTQLSYDLLWMIANSKGLKIPAKPRRDSPWTGPDPNLVRVQAILFASFTASLLAAFVAMLGKQWLNQYSQVDMRGSPIDRSRDRHRKMNAMATWRFKLVMESLPLMLQVALLLLGYALSKYLFTTEDLVAGVVAGLAGFGFLFYLAIVVVATIYRDCPFQTPLSRIFRFMGSSLKSFGTWFLRTLKRWRRQPGDPFRFTLFCGPNGNNFDEGVPLATVGPPRSPLVLFGDEDDQKAYLLDSNCIAWMFEMSMDPDVIIDIMKFIPEIIWHDGIRTTPLEKLYDTVLECFDFSSRSPILIPKFRNKAYRSAKALVHIAIQRKCIDDGPNNDVFRFISDRPQVFGSGQYDGDSDLEYTLGMIDSVFKNKDPDSMRWNEFIFTSSHHAWMGHILFYRASHLFRKGGTLPDDIKGFVTYSLRMDPPPDASIILNCLLMIYLTLGIQSDGGEQHIIDDSQKFHPQIDKIHVKLVEMFGNLISPDANIVRAFEAMEFIAPLSKIGTAAKNYDLFRVIVRAIPDSSPVCPEMWKASRLALHLAYKWDEGLPCVEDPGDILAFLNHHFNLAKKDGDHDGPIQDALSALAYASTPETIEAFKGFNPTQTSFMHRVCHLAFQGTPSLELRKAALLSLPLFADKLSNHSEPIMKHEEMCRCWAPAVCEVWDPDDTRKPAPAVLDIVIPPHWSLYIVPGDKESVGMIPNTGNSEGETFRSAILRSKRNGLEPGVQGRSYITKGKEVHRRLSVNDRVGVEEG